MNFFVGRISSAFLRFFKGFDIVILPKTDRLLLFALLICMKKQKADFFLKKDLTFL